jgi:hypothetical protein
MVCKKRDSKPRGGGIPISLCLPCLYKAYEIYTRWQINNVVAEQIIHYQNDLVTEMFIK